MKQTDYLDFLKAKQKSRHAAGFKPIRIPDCLFPFQAHLTDWSIRLGRAALMEDCGLGKSVQEICFGDNVIRHTNKPVLLLTPLAVAEQMIREANKFGFEAKRTKNGEVHRAIINVVNYDRLHKYNPKDFAGVICDEASVLKSFDGKTRKLVTEFMSKVPYRLLATATPAPNDYMELGSSSEALGVMGRNQMLGMFFTNDGESTQQWTLKGHARTRFWEWMATWARAVRKPSDLGFSDDGFILPPLNVEHHVIKDAEMDGFYPTLAKTLSSQLHVRRTTIQERCEKAASIVPKKGPVVIWCHLNKEGDLLEKMIPDAVQVAGSQTEEQKEERLMGFSTGRIRVLITKVKIGGFGLNWQHCREVIYFPSHSHEAHYQAIRRCWRFGQKEQVNCHLVYTEREKLVVQNMLRKERLAIQMYDGICRSMARAIEKKAEGPRQEMRIPEWL